ncbi:hypothetical protein CBR_g36889 [Chara braunii]|uniref:Uncharacterized protein n=1 Tax=Chara braunii TaxID=69332 RepID=A0A388LLV1_CHABU|nr:hypothetical protein CBR_g36889 [Chara braunii]|eukprot:GBG83274.1 hypothetical protein CBR_g36889 [Chara braunii]
MRPCFCRRSRPRPSSQMRELRVPSSSSAAPSSSAFCRPKDANCKARADFHNFSSSSFSSFSSSSSSSSRRRTCSSSSSCASLVDLARSCAVSRVGGWLADSGSCSKSGSRPPHAAIPPLLRAKSAILVSASSIGHPTLRPIIGDVIIARGTRKKDRAMIAEKTALAFLSPCSSSSICTLSTWQQQRLPPALSPSPWALLAPSAPLIVGCDGALFASVQGSRQAQRSLQPGSDSSLVSGSRQTMSASLRRKGGGGGGLRAKRPSFLAGKHGAATSTSSVSSRSFRRSPALSRVLRLIRGPPPPRGNNDDVTLVGARRDRLSTCARGRRGGRWVSSVGIRPAVAVAAAAAGRYYYAVAHRGGVGHANKPRVLLSRCHVAVHYNSMAVKGRERMTRRLLMKLQSGSGEEGVSADDDVIRGSVEGRSREDGDGIKVGEEGEEGEEEVIEGGREEVKDGRQSRSTVDSPVFQVVGTSGDAKFAIDYLGESTKGDMLVRPDIAESYTDSESFDVESAFQEEVRLEIKQADALLTQMGIPAVFPHGERSRGIFCSRTLNLRSISTIGYDMDYTLVHYDVEAWEGLAYNYGMDNLRKMGYPVDGLRFDPDLAIRGLIMDKERGNLVKADRFGIVKRAMHGTKMLSKKAISQIYGREFVDLRSESRWEFLNTLFSISEAVMFMQMVQRLNEGALPPDLGPLDYTGLYKVVAKALFQAHVEGQLKAEIISDPERYIELDPELPLALLDQKEVNIIFIFLIHIFPNST